MIAFVFPGQASQFVGMGKDLMEDGHRSGLFSQANDILGFDIRRIMCEGSEEDLVQTSVTQPAVFLHSVMKYLSYQGDLRPTAVAGHSLGEFSALVANGCLTFEDGLQLVRARAEAMQRACDSRSGTMAAIVGIADEVVEQVCSETEGIVVPANFNCPGQLVISGAHAAVTAACEALTKLGARRAILLPVGGAFHSPLMQPAQTELAAAIEKTAFSQPICPIYQNVNGLAQQDPVQIRTNLVQQLTSPVRWTTTIQNLISGGTNTFVEVGGTGKVLQGMIKRIDRESVTSAL